MNVYDEDYVDGIDKMKHFGFNIHNWIDGYSRKIMWMEKVYSSKYLKILLHSYLFTIKKSQFCYLLCKGFSWEFDYRSCLTMGTIFLESRQQTKTLNFFHGYVQDILDGVTTYWNHHKIHKSQLTILTRLTTKYSAFFATPEWYHRIKQSYWYRKIGLISQNESDNLNTKMPRWYM